MIGLLGKRHPTQIYEAIDAIAIFLILLKLKEVLKKKGKPEGLILSLYFLFFGITHLFLEYFRGDSVYFKSWNINQIFFLILSLISIVLVYIRMGRKNYV